MKICKKNVFWLPLFSLMVASCTSFAQAEDVVFFVAKTHPIVIFGVQDSSYIGAYSTLLDHIDVYDKKGVFVGSHFSCGLSDLIYADSVVSSLFLDDTISSEITFDLPPDYEIVLVDTVALLAQRQKILHALMEK